METAFAADTPGLVYASVNVNNGSVYQSKDSGATWRFLSNPQHLGTQGFHANAIWVSPGNANRVVVGGVDLYQSTDGGLTFSAITNWKLWPNSPHADNHVIVGAPDYGNGNNRVYVGNDGGVYKADYIGDANNSGAGNGWVSLNNGLAVTEFYSGASSSNGLTVYGGTQDNGSLLYTGSSANWTTVFGGDGGFSAIDPTDANYIYGEYTFLSIHRSVDGGASRAKIICGGITKGGTDASTNKYCGPNATAQANFIAPFVLDPNNPNQHVCWR